MNNIPNNFVIDFTQVLDVWVTIKALVILTTCLYASFGKGDGLNRLYKVVVFGVAIFALTGCVGPDDSLIAQSSAMTAQTQANAALTQQQGTALQTSSNQAAQANAQAQTALAVAQIQASEASKAQAQEGIAQAQAQAQLGIAQTNANANIVANSLLALDNAAERQAQQLIFYNLMVAVILIAIVILAILYLKWRLRMVEIASKQSGDYARLQMQSKPVNSYELLEYARSAGYLIESKGNGYSEVRHPQTKQLVSKQQLLLEIKE